VGVVKEVGVADNDVGVTVVVGVVSKQPMGVVNEVGVADSVTVMVGVVSV
jgi:ribonuclease HIII